MKGALIVVGGIVAAVFLVVLIIGLTWIGAVNAEASARNSFLAQQKANESSFDKTWKVIQQNAEVTTTERESFRKIYPEIMSATKGVAGNGQLMSMFQQAKIDISPALFSKLMTTIESQRESFHRDQQKLLQLKKQHDDIRTRFPSSLFVGGRPELEAKIVTSTKTTESFESGEDNETKLFK